MRRWNGWGDDQTTYPVPASAISYLTAKIGATQNLRDVSFEEIIPQIPPSRLPLHPLVITEPGERLLHARGQSLPDWIALRSGRISAFPDGVAYPSNDDEVRSLLNYVRQADACVIPYGGGTSVVGHINPPSKGMPALTLDLSRLNQLHDFDETSRLATFGAGVRGPDLEKALNSRGYTLGHFPQSFELSTLGGWVATRSCGQQSYYYGRIEELFAGGHVETPVGCLDFPPHPASAAGPDLRQIFLGSEGRLGILTRAVMRVRRLPNYESFYGVFFRDWETGVAAVRTLVQEKTPLSMLRLSDPQETETTLILSGKDNLVRWAKRGLNLLGYSENRCLLTLGVTGNPDMARFVYRSTLAILRDYGGLMTGSLIGRTWQKSRFLTPYLRNSLWELGYATDTLETAVPWKDVLTTAQAIKSVLQSGLETEGEKVLVFAHLSHVYRDGASIYVTFLFRRSAEPDITLRRWQKLKAAASQEILAHGGTISHQHGVGLDHVPYLAPEKSSLGISLLAACASAWDPEGRLNPGKLFDLSEAYHVG